MFGLVASVIAIVLLISNWRLRHSKAQVTSNPLADKLLQARDHDGRPSAFLSLRFPSADGGRTEPGALDEMLFVRTALEAKGVRVLPKNNPGNTDREAEIAWSIDLCDIFIVFGTQTYGQNTGNPMCTFYEFKMAHAEAKPLVWIKMSHKIAEPTVRMGLKGLIYKEWEENDAMIDWIMDRLATARADAAAAALREQPAATMVQGVVGSVNGGEP